jgi:hypothetical protein
MKKLLLLCLLFPSLLHAQSVTLAGQFHTSNGLPASNDTVTFTLSQAGFISGVGTVVPLASTCATSTDGSIVWLGNPLRGPNVATLGSGSLAPATYYVQIGFYDSLGHVTLASPEIVQPLASSGSLQVSPPSSGVPTGAVGMNVYIGATSGSERLQGQTTGTNSFVQSTALSSGTALPSSNTTICTQYANDAIWPVGTGYIVSLMSPSGDQLPGFPMQWQLTGVGTTINISNGFPLYNGVVFFPTPILAAPQNHGPQSISGPLNFGGYNVLNVGRLGAGTSTPGWGVDAHNGAINADFGYLFAGAAPSNHVLLGNGSNYVDSATIPWAIISGSPTLFYQTVDANGTAQTQRPALNFDSTLSTADSISPAQTNVGMPNVGTAGSCTACNETIDAQGRVTAYSTNSGAGTTVISTFTGCSFGTDGANLTCTNTVMIAAMPDTSYTVECTEYTTGPTSVILGNITYAVISTTIYTVTEMTQGSSTDWTAYHNYGKSYVCTAHHN